MDKNFFLFVVFNNYIYHFINVVYYLITLISSITISAVIIILLLQLNLFLFFTTIILTFWYFSNLAGTFVFIYYHVFYKFNFC